MEAARYERMYEVVELYLKSENETKIAKALGIPRKEVLGLLDEWRHSAVASEYIKDRVEELMRVMDEHYSSLIRKYYEIVDEVDSLPGPSAQMLAQKANALKGIADLENKRIETLQRSGLLDAADLGNEIAEMERQRDIILDILQNDLCETCSIHVSRRMGEVLGQPQPLVVVDE